MNAIVRSPMACNPGRLVHRRLRPEPNDQIGREVAIPVHLQDGKGSTVSRKRLTVPNPELRSSMQNSPSRKELDVPSEGDPALHSPISALRLCFQGTSTASPRRDTNTSRLPTTLQLWVRGETASQKCSSWHSALIV